MMRALKSVLTFAALLLVLFHGTSAYAEIFTTPSCGSVRWDWRPDSLTGIVTTANGSAVLSNVPPGIIGGVVLGMLVTGNGIGAAPSGQPPTEVTAIDVAARTVTVSVASTRTGTATVAFTPNPKFPAEVEYKRAGDPSYIPGPALVHDNNDPGFRGVIPDLEPSAAYDIRLTLHSNPPHVEEKAAIATLEWKFTPTFHSVGMCWAPPGKAANVVAQARFKPAGAPDSAYRQGLDLWYDPRTNLLQNAEYRGSLVELQPDTGYDVELKLPGTGLTRTIANAVRTWSDSFAVPDGNTLTISAGITHLVIMPADIPAPTSSLNGTTQTISVPTSGSASSYTLVTGNPGQNTIDQNAITTSDPLRDNCIVVKQGTHHVIIRDLKLANCKRNGIFIERQFITPPLKVQTTDIVIEGNEIFGWGGRGQDSGVQQLGDPNAPNADQAIFCNYFRETADAIRPDRIIIQRNTIHDPRFSATPWGPNSVHPWGPQPVGFTKCGTNHVIRYNDMYSTANAQGVINHFMDGIGGGDNFSTRGFPSADSDIYGNRVSQVYDDSIESEGGNRNVRIWGNYMDRTMVAIGNAHTSVGPLYVWRNVSNDMSRMFDPSAPADSGPRGSFVKTVSGNSATLAVNGGRAYFFHNTVLQPPPSGGATLPFGAGHILGDNSDPARAPFHNFVSKNNIWQTHRPIQINGLPKFESIMGNCDPAQGRPCEADSDLYNGKVFNAGVNPEANGWGSLAGDPKSVPTYRNAAAGSNGNYPAMVPGPANPWSGDFRLADGSFGTLDQVNPPRRVALIPNFNDLEATRHVGAQPLAQGVMMFGTGAALGPTAMLNASPESGPATLSVSFDASASQPGNAPISTYRIDFGDQASGSGATQSHSYTTQGTYEAVLTVTDTAGRTSIARRTITVTAIAGPRAVLSASPLSGIPGVTVTFDASGSKQGSAPISTYSIDFGDQTSGTGPKQSHTYGAAGKYIAVLTVTDANGLQSSDPKTIEVTSDPDPVFPGSSAFRIFLSAGPGLTISRVGGERIDFSLSAGDGRPLSKVRFFLQGAHRLTDTAAPFQFTWAPAPSDPAGNYVLVAEATDTAGNVAAESRTLTLLSNTCSIFPSATSVIQGQPIYFQGVCSATQSVERVEFFVDDILQSPNRDVAPPYTWTMDTSAFALGTRVVRVRGATGSTLLGEESASIQILAAPLTLTLSPGAVIHRTEDLTVTAVATDGRALKQVDFYVNGDFIEGENIAPFSMSWRAGGSSPRPDRLGRHQLYVQATDLNGNVLTATRDLYMLTDICNVLLGTSKYGVSSHDTVLAGPHTVIQGQRFVVQGLCSASQTVQQIEFYVDTAPQTTDVVGPYGTAISTASFALGPHTVSITARLAGGAVVNHSIPIEIVAPRP
jgi:PKD repeat protein